MSIEFEAKVIEINPAEMEQKIMQAGGKKVREALMKRYVYDIDPNRRGHWIRLRDDGDQVTLTVKKIHHDGISGTEEEEIVVQDFEKTNQLLRLMGFSPSAYQENHRTSFVLDGAQLEIDHWPLIPAYLEIEADSYERVVEVGRMLDLKEEQLTGENTTKIYKRYGIDLDQKRELRFVTK
ncbi:CYTH domain-containing protein [Shimazuella sp. AN120528]|uniref:class IV adenylate cyclase n=1 Tax=Shimazuella soli TaxID=1892854 RepID=UPI001F10F1BC|nr:CYTH domain-containing protein [Shimazuella soli]MCH5585794.1 CYTH domain-containing protein [Shimazuella soli]